MNKDCPSPQPSPSEGRGGHTDCDKFPGLLENPAGYRKSSDDYAVTISVPIAYVDRLKPLMQKAGRAFVVYLVQVATPEQAVALMDAEDSPATGLPVSDADPHADGPSPVSLDLMAQVLGVDPRTVQLDAEKGLLVRTTRGQYDTLASCATLRKALRSAEAGSNDQLVVERAKTIRFNRERKEVDLYERLGKLVNFDELLAAREKKDTDIKQKILFFEKTLPPLFNLTPEQVVMLKNVIRQLLVELAAAPLRGLRDRGGGQNVPAASGNDRERVGGRKKISRRKNKR